MYPNTTTTGLLSKLLNLKNTIKWTELLEGTKKTLDVVNQAIPIYYQVKPIINNAKTMFKIVNVVNSDDSNNSNKETKEEISTTENSSNTSPIFYL